LIPRAALGAAAAWALAGAAAAPAPSVTPMAADAQPRIAALAADMTSALGVPGVAVVVGRADGAGGYADVARVYTGRYGPESVEPIASASKWFTAATVAAVADAGKLRLDDPVGRYLPAVPADKAGITVRQTLSHLSGLPQLGPFAERRYPDLAASAAGALTEPLAGTPGTVLLYSGTAMQVGARAAEIADGRDFRAIFDARIAKPLKLAHTRYGLDSRSAPVTGGGLLSTPADIETFAKMIAGYGTAGGVRVLAAATVRDMTQLRSKGARIVAIPRQAESFAGMATGMWCEKADAAGRCLVVSSVGAFGTYAWVDYEHGEYGVMFVRTALPRAMPWWVKMRQAIDATRPKLSKPF